MKRSERNRLDREVGAKVRARGKCERCGARSNLQCCHIFSRRYSKLRHDLANLLCLCAACHFWAHQKPLLFAEFCRQYLGASAYQKLIDKRNEI